MSVDVKFKNLRVRLRNNSKKIIDDVVLRHLSKIKAKYKSKIEICIFCGSETDLTKEHVIPKWTFENVLKSFLLQE